MAERAIYTDADASFMRARCAGQPYRPSNGTEGAIFETAWCAHCRAEDAYRAWWNNGGPPSEQPESCTILVNAMAFSIDDPDYPPEWIYGQDGQPRCTAFVDRHDARTDRCRETADLFASPAPAPGAAPAEVA